MFYGYSAYNEHNLILRFIMLCITAGITDLLIYFIYKSILKPLLNAKVYRLMNVSHWIALGIFIAGGTLLYVITGYPCDDHDKLFIYSAFFTLFFTWYIPKIIFSILMGIWLLLTSLKNIFRKKQHSFKHKKANLLAFTVCLLFVIFLAATFIIGTFYGRNNFKVKEQSIYLENLPQAFDGYRIVQISDLHLGNIKSVSTLDEITERINSLQPDMIVFSGDLVNLTAKEALPFVPAMKKLYAPAIKFSILGNHDFGDYVLCYDSLQKLKTTQELIDIEQQMGFRVLLNSHAIVQKGNDSIIIAGVKNWSKKPYHQYGNIKEALKNVPDKGFVILLSHDPEHWDSEVAEMTGIPLTLSGHTHGGQVGIQFKNFTLSIYSLKEDLCAGLYKRNDHYLYINQGLGVIGLLTRAGIPPEISLITLKKSVK